MTDRVPPHDLEAEEHILGSMMLTDQALTYAVETVTPEDFYKPSHGLLFATMADLWRSAEPVDVTTVVDSLRQSGLLDKVGDPQTLLGYRSQVPASTKVKGYCRIVIEHAARRQVIAIGSAAVESAYRLTDPSELIDSFGADLQRVDLPLGKVPGNLWPLDEFQNRTEDHSPWVVPGLLRKGWRAITVAAEGVGKSLLAEQVAMCAAAGVHPFTARPMPPVVSLLVDLENDAHRIIDGTRLIDDRLGLRRVKGGVWLWHEQGGINLRNRRDRSTFEAVLTHCRPQLVCLGPVYKMYQAKAAEGYELPAAEVQSVLDDLRTRFGFALLLEHHAAKGEGRAPRVTDPYGSSLWLRWPEFGLGLDEIAGSENLKVRRWRKDRVKGEWPNELHKGKPPCLPWQGWWKDGIPSLPVGGV